MALTVPIFYEEG